MSGFERNRDTKIKAVIFDLDNTLVDFVEAKTNACEAVARHLGRNDAVELLHCFVKGDHGIENTLNIRDYLLARNIYSDDAFRRCNDIYESTKLGDIRLYDGIADALARIRRRGLKIAIVTDAARKNALERLDRVGIFNLFDMVVTFEDTGRKKPSTAPFEHVLGKFGVRPEEAVLVGDSLDRDIVPGNRLGMHTVHARYGDRNFFEARKEAADFVIDDIGQLETVIDNITVQ